MQLAGKVAIVTGASRGIGKAIALRYAREGASVVIAARAEDLVGKVAAEAEALGGRGLGVVTDVADEDSVRRMVEKTLATFGTIDVLVNNAAVRRRHFVHEMPTSELMAMLSTNLVGGFFCCRAVLPTMYAKQDGTVLFISSRSGMRPTKANSAYCASKAGQIALMQSLAVEARPHKVRVNAISVSSAATEIHAATINTEGWLQPEEIADVALFLATDQSRAMTGQVLNVWGGVNYHDWATTDRTL